MSTSIPPTPNGWQIPGRGRFALLGRCPTPCDPDCGTLCHEGHQVLYKRTHREDQCPPVFAWLDVT